MRGPQFYFSNIFNSYLEQCKNIGSIIHYPANTIINGIGEPFSTVEYILSGNAVLGILNACGEENLVCFFGHDSIFPPYSSPKIQYRVETDCLFVKSVTDVTSIRMSQKDFFELMNKHTPLMVSMMDFFADLTELMLFEISNKSYTDTFTKVCTFLWVYNQVLSYEGIIMTQEEIASAVGITRVAVARVLHVLRDHNIITTSKKQIRIINEKELAKLCRAEIIEP